MNSQRIHHTLKPWYTPHSRILILGTMPSPKSRETACYYGHPQNRFWSTLASVFNEQTPQCVEQRKEFVIKHNIALWDVLASCDMRGAEDASITNPVANNIAALLQMTNISRIYTTGQKAKRLYDQLVYSNVGIPAVALPSTSPANCRWYSDTALREAYVVISDNG